VRRDDLELRNRTYGLFVSLGRAPTAGETAGAAGMTADEVRTGWRRLQDAHALVLDSSGGELRMATPFSAVPTAYRVEAAGHWWYANCAWDAFGVCAALETDGRIESSCPDCGAAISIGVSRAKPDDEELVFHCLVPASAWWDDIVFT
jgi:hypothetical protein